MRLSSLLGVRHLLKSTIPAFDCIWSGMPDQRFAINLRANIFPQPLQEKTGCESKKRYTPLRGVKKRYFDFAGGDKNAETDKNNQFIIIAI